MARTDGPVEVSASQKLIRDLKKQLSAAADPVKAPIMQVYMKSAMPYLGVQTPQLRALTRSVFAAHPIESFEQWRDTVLSLWRGAKYREQRYAAIALAGDRKHAPFQTLDAVPVYEEMITSGAWWDYVDAIASRHLGSILRKFPKEMSKLMRTWSKSEDIWKRRSAILVQLSFKADTDLVLLYDCIGPSLRADEFFLRKAIGWALRQYAWTNAREVLRYVREHEKELSRLTKREALKNIPETRDRA